MLDAHWKQVYGVGLTVGPSGSLVLAGVNLTNPNGNVTRYANSPANNFAAWAGLGNNIGDNFQAGINVTDPKQTASLTSFCKLCPDGTKPSANSETCVTCPWVGVGGKVCDLTNRCDASKGETVNELHTGCIVCPAGSKPTPGTGVGCVQCSDGNANFVAQLASTDTGLNIAGAGGICADVRDPTDPRFATALCPPKTKFVPGVCSATACPAGTWPNVNSARCATCPVRDSSVPMGRAGPQCVLQCDPSTVTGLDHARCTQCPSGSYPSPDQTVCVPCPGGWAGVSGLCAACPEGTAPSVDRFTCYVLAPPAAQNFGDDHGLTWKSGASGLLPSFTLLLAALVSALAYLL